ncbi:Primase 2 (plasmid) [Calothrix sp. NIES-4071]|nr:Primase 2 [Calothrix sp. NIES-4071]BAZ64845.1 Primase 2 [Calothrix sp. NIES-4105]
MTHFEDFVPTKRTTSPSLKEFKNGADCPHCHHSGWCYSVGDLSVCNRGAAPALGWFETSKSDKAGVPYYAPISTKAPRAIGREEFVYTDRDNNPLIKVVIVRKSETSKEVYQEYWNGIGWAKASSMSQEMKRTLRSQITWYRYNDVLQAVLDGEHIFVVEGEGVADLLWNLGLPATTTIGGAGKYRAYGSYKEDLSGANIILCPDRDEPGVKHMEDIYQDFPEAQWLYAPPSEFYWSKLPTSGGLDIKDWVVTDGATVEDILAAIVGAPTHSYNSTEEIKVSKITDKKSAKQEVKSVDNRNVLTLEKVEVTPVSEVVNGVNKILKLNLGEFEEYYKLDLLRRSSKIDKKLFDKIVASERVAYEVQPEDEIRLKTLIDWSQQTINWDEVLPAPLARIMKRDAQVLNIDPVMLWQPLLSTISSLIGGRVYLDLGGRKVPSMMWTVSVSESGTGKTRADSVVLDALRKMQIEANRVYTEEKKEYEKALKEYQKNKEEGEAPTPPVLKKHLFEVATIQALYKRLAQQGGNTALWARDEIAGLFKSLGQFHKGDCEAEQLLVKLWDEALAVAIDRVGDDDSFFGERMSLAITGGIQPGVFRKVFRDESDASGMQARILFAVPQKGRKCYVEGFCELSETLPLMFNYAVSMAPNNIKMAPDAKKYFAKLVELIGDQADATKNPGIRVWMNKLDTQVLRIALNLHIIECFYYRERRDINTLQLDTLQRAVKFAQYYRSAFHVLQEKITDSDDISSILLQIYDRALQQPDGVSPRDVYRPSRSIQARAKTAHRECGSYVEDLFRKMEQMGYGECVRNGRLVKFVASKFIGANKFETHADSVDIIAEDALKTDKIREFDITKERQQSESVNNQSNASHAEQSSTEEVKNTSEPTLEVEVPKVKDTSEQNKAPEVEESSELRKAHKEVEAPEALNISLLQVEVDGDVNGFVGCNVEVRGISGAVKATGTLTNYDELNGSVTIETQDGACVKAHVRETFVI